MSNKIENLLREMEQEANTTRKMLSRIPNDKFSWKPHEKSMPISRLSTHIAELPGWVTMALTTDEIDFANPESYNRLESNSKAQLLPYFEETLADGKTHLENADESTFGEKWILRKGDQILQEYTRDEVIRMAYNQIVHHRAQLGVYLRLLNVPIPGSYGPSADEPAF